MNKVPQIITLCSFYKLALVTGKEEGMLPEDDFLHLSWFCFVHIRWKKLANCELRYHANLLVVARYGNAHETVSEHLTCQVGAYVS